MNRGIILCVLLAGAAPMARADYAVLRSGVRLHITGYETAGDRVRLSVEGGTVEVAAAEIVSIESSLVTPAGKFSNLVYVVENSSLETGSSKKWYAMGVGAVKDGEMELTKFGMKP